MPDAARLPFQNANVARFAVSAEDGLWRAIELALDNLYGIVFVTDPAGKLIGQVSLDDMRAALRDGRHLGDIKMGALARACASTIIRGAGKAAPAPAAPVVDEAGRLIDIALDSSAGFVSIAEPDLSHTEFRNLLDAFLSTWISSAGDYITDFEKAFAARCDMAHGIGTSNGTVSLHLTMAALGIKPGDEVIVPDLTFPAVANTVIQLGATPVLVDIDPNTWCLSVEQFERAITPKTRMVMPVHAFGRPAPMREIMEIAAQRQIYVFEDAAEAPGATYDGKPVGSFGEASSFSFFANKIITTGEGGIVLVKDAELADRLRMLRSHGMRLDRRYWHEEVGFNYRMTNLQASIGLAQLERLDEFIAARRTLEGLYRNAMAGIPGVAFPPPTPANVKPVVWFVTVTVPIEKRAEVVAEAKKRGLDLRTMVHSMSIMPAYRPYARPCPESRALSDSALHLPSFSRIDEDVVGRIADAFRAVLK